MKRDLKIKVEGVEQDLTFDAEKNSYALDVSPQDSEYDHPSDYETISKGAVDDDSTYDNSNPFVGDEYAKGDELAQDELHTLNMNIRGDEIVKLDKVDQILSKTEEDFRDDLDEEGYPKNS